jgi:hypothetical protein
VGEGVGFGVGTDTSGGTRVRVGREALASGDRGESLHMVKGDGGRGDGRGDERGEGVGVAGSGSCGEGPK